jgi:CBS-domain-containing membrane protein
MWRDVASCRASASLSDAARILWDRDCGCVPIVDADGQLVGMLTDRDICMAAHFRNLPLTEITVADVMSTEPAICRPDDTLADAQRVMSGRQVRRLPVVDGARGLIGILSSNDIVREAANPRPGHPRVKTHEVLRTLAAIGQRKLREPWTTAA